MLSFRAVRARLLSMSAWMALVAWPTLADELPSSEQAAAVVERLIAGNTKAGSFRFEDTQRDQTLSLVKEQVHVIRHLAGVGFVVDVDFHDARDPQKPYDIDFWLSERELRPIQARIHKEPQKESGEWRLVARSPLVWWWRCTGSCSKECFPEAAHPERYPKVRAWQVEAAATQYVERNSSNGVFPLRDDSTGELHALELVEVRTPPVKLKSGGYSVSATFRSAERHQKLFDVDVLLAQSPTGLQVTAARIQKSLEKSATSSTPSSLSPSFDRRRLLNRPRSDQSSISCRWAGRPGVSSMYTKTCRWS